MEEVKITLLHDNTPTQTFHTFQTKYRFQQTPRPLCLFTTSSKEERPILRCHKHFQIYSPGTLGHSEESVWKSFQTEEGSMGKVRCFRSSLFYENHEPETNKCYIPYKSAITIDGALPSYARIRHTIFSKVGV